MSQALAHFALGAAATTLVVTFLVPGVRYPRTAVLIGGGWAMIPDFYWISPVAEAQLRRIHQTSPLTDVFWFHRALDHLDPADTNEIAALCLAVFLAATAIAERREYRVPAPVRTLYDGHGSTESAD